MRVSFLLPFLITVAHGSRIRDWSILEQSPQTVSTRKIDHISSDGDAWQNSPSNTQFQTEPSLEGEPPTQGARFWRARYGPITIKPLAHTDDFVTSIPKPCSTCWATAFQTQLYFSDNLKATSEQGIILENFVLYDNSKRDLVCQVSGVPLPARIHASDDLRQVSRINAGNAPYGIRIDEKSRLSMSFNVTNENLQTRMVYLETIYEILENQLAVNFRPAAMVWIDLTGCSQTQTPSQLGAYAIRSPSWKSTVSGRILEVVGHLSDGGTDITVLVNGQVVCVHNVKYGNYRRASYLESSTNTQQQEQHIAEISVCKNFGYIRVGDTVSITARFDNRRNPIVQSLHARSRTTAMSRMYLTDSL